MWSKKHPPRASKKPDGHTQHRLLSFSTHTRFSLSRPSSTHTTGRQQTPEPVGEGAAGGGEAFAGHREQDAARPHVGAATTRRPRREEADPQDPQGHVQAREALSAFWSLCSSWLLLCCHVDGCWCLSVPVSAAALSSFSLLHLVDAAVARGEVLLDARLLRCRLGWLATGVAIEGWV